MKTFKTIILALCVSLSGYAQDPQLFEYDWYLHTVIIDNEEHPLPNPNFIGSIFFFFSSEDFIEVGHPMCEEFFGSPIEYLPGNSFNIDNGGVVIIGICGDPEIIAFMEKHYSVYYLENIFAKNPFNYIFTNENGLIILTITNVDGDQAIYGNEQLSSPDFNSAAFEVYPNPVQNELFLSSKNGDVNLTIKIFNIEGKLLSTRNLDFESEASLDVSRLSSGIYFLNVEDENGKRATKKFVKE